MNSCAIYLCICEALPPVYPRWRGEHLPSLCLLTTTSGLSPLARGTPQCGGIERPGDRFIPAGAGNTVSSPSRCTGSAVYPRWRGEHVSIPNIKPLQFGLSPLARGTLTVINIKVSIERFIPAGAGNTLDSASWSRLSTVYPRWRGEH